MLQPAQYIAYLGKDRKFSNSISRQLESDDVSVIMGANGGFVLASRMLNGGLSADVNDQNTILVRDGDRGFFSAGNDAHNDDVDRWYAGVSSPGSVLSIKFSGDHGMCKVHADWAGIFPVYVSEVRDGIIIGNNIRLLQDFVRSDPDIVGISQFLAHGYCLSGRTCISRIQRLAPGQRLVFDSHTRKTSVSETSELWTGGEVSPNQNIVDVVEEADHRLGEAVATSISGSTKAAMMMSAGWDSRTLLGEMMSGDKADEEFVCYFHGDSSSREAAITQRLCEVARVEFLMNEILSSSFQIDSLEEMFSRTANVVFPHWYEAGRNLSQTGVDTIVSGVYGEIFGGHYGRSMAYSGVRQGIAVACEYLGLSDNVFRWSPPVGHGRSILEKLIMRKPWALSEEVTTNISQPCAEDLALTIDRLLNRGVPDDHRLIEAFISEHRGGQYISQQALSCRSETAVSVPFGDREFLKFATCIPSQLKVHNRANRKLLMRIAPSLLDLPMAATIAPAKYSVVVQEASRVARKVYESSMWYLHNRTRRVRQPRLGWANFESVRQSNALSSVADSLQSPIWRKDKIRDACLDFESQDGTHTQPLVDMMMKIATVEFTVK